MHIVHCSGKLGEFVGRGNLVRPPEEFIPDRLFQWNAQLFYNNRRKCLLLTNKATLYSVVCLNFVKPYLVDMSGFLSEALSNQLDADGLHAGNTLFNLPAAWHLSPTDNDKKVIGSMNDFVYQLKVAIEYKATGFDPPSDTRAASNINRVPMRTIKMQQPIDCLRSLLLLPPQIR